MISLCSPSRALDAFLNLCVPFPFFDLFDNRRLPATGLIEKTPAAMFAGSSSEAPSLRERAVRCAMRLRAWLRTIPQSHVENGRPPGISRWPARRKGRPPAPPRTLLHIADHAVGDVEHLFLVSPTRNENASVSPCWQRATKPASSSPITRLCASTGAGFSGKNFSPCQGVRSEAIPQRNTVCLIYHFASMHANNRKFVIADSRPVSAENSWAAGHNRHCPKGGCWAGDKSGACNHTHPAERCAPFVLQIDGLRRPSLGLKSHDVRWRIFVTAIAVPALSSACPDRAHPASCACRRQRGRRDRPAPYLRNQTLSLPGRVDRRGCWGRVVGSLPRRTSG